MTSIDDLIKEALTAQESEIIESTEELGYFSLAMGLFSGKLGWVSWVIMLVQGAMFVAGVWAAWQERGGVALDVGDAENEPDATNSGGPRVAGTQARGASDFASRGRIAPCCLRPWPRCARWRRGKVALV